MSGWGSVSKLGKCAIFVSRGFKPYSKPGIFNGLGLECQFIGHNKTTPGQDRPHKPNCVESTKETSKRLNALDLRIAGLQGSSKGIASDSRFIGLIRVYRLGTTLFLLGSLIITGLLGNLVGLVGLGCSGLVFGVSPLHR